LPARRYAGTVYAIIGYCLSQVGVLSIWLNGLNWVFNREDILNLSYTQCHKEKIKNHAWVIFHPFAGTPSMGRLVWILACWVILQRNLPCQILWQSVRGFWSSDTPNFAILHIRVFPEIRVLPSDTSFRTLNLANISAFLKFFSTFYCRKCCHLSSTDHHRYSLSHWASTFVYNTVAR